ncbi:hypothetical protein PFISCL1PPCAC_26544, partial [Pristionchus fissidentatus]
ASAGEHFHYHNAALHHKLTIGYRREVSPYTEGGLHRIPLDVSLSYARMVSLEQMEEVLHLIVYFRLIWHDGRFEWSSGDYGGINHIYLSLDNVWMPQITILNDKDEANRQFFSMFGRDFFSNSKKPNVLINNTGHVHFYSQRIADIVCPLDNNLFPFDKQTCALMLVRRRCFNVNEPMIVAGISEGLLTHNQEYMGNGEWEVLGITTFEKNKNDTYGPIDIVGFAFRIKRKPEFYIVMVILPTFIMTTLTILGIFGRSTSIENEFISELSLGITSLTTIALMLDIVAEYMPKTDVFPLITKFMITHITLMALSILTVIIHPHFLYPKYRRIKSALLKSIESNVMPVSPHRDRIARFLRRSLKKYRPANIVFMIIFQSLNIASVAYMLSFWK